ncbi:hypothetical protein [Knoellia remsis]|nr:hypothetical protein [Knoellia remsis]
MSESENTETPADTEATGGTEDTRGGTEDTRGDAEPAPERVTDDEVRDEVRLDLDQESIEDWDDVRDDYAVDPGQDPVRPALSEDE